MGRKLRADQHGVFPYFDLNRYAKRDRLVGRELAKRAGLPDPEVQSSFFENLGNRELPVWKKKAEIQRTIRDNQVSMIEGPTGSGKSTQLAQYALEMGYKKIVYLEPRIPLADNVSDRFIQELNEQLGDGSGDQLVGVRHSERSTGHGKVIEAMTPDTFLRVYSEIAEQYSNEPVLFVGDEIHEKDFPTELGVAVVAESLPDHPKWRLCVMSATLDAQPIQEAYGAKLGRNVPLVSIEGRPFELEMIEEPELTMDEAYSKYRDSHTKAQLFTAGKGEISDISTEIYKHRYPRTRVTPFHAKLSRAKILQATHARLAQDEKQVIPSTNAGASGITIPGQTLVISDGTVRRQDLDMDGTPGLFREYCAQDELVQQAGRAGRDVGGGLFVLVKPDDDENFEFRSLERRVKHAPAQIYHTNISRNVLAVMNLDRDFYGLNKWLIHDVQDRVIIEAYDTLYRLGGIDELNRLTDIGRQMNQFPVRPQFSRALVAASQSGASPLSLQQLAATVASIESGGLPYFERGVGAEWRKDIRDEVDDDYMAQLDMFIATRQFYDGRDVDEAALEARNYDLQQTRKAHRTYDKICRTLGVEINDGLLAPSIEEMNQLRNYLVYGLFDFAHSREASLDSSGKPTYISVYDDDSEKPRTLSDRGTYKPNDSLVLGMPRRYEKRVKGSLEEFSVIENVMPVAKEQLAKAAFWLVTHIPDRTQINNGRLERIGKQMLGKTVIGESILPEEIIHTSETRTLLREAAFAKPTQALAELLAIKKEIEWLVRRIPEDEIERYFPRGILTDEWLMGRIDAATDNNVDSIFALDNNLRREIVVQGILRSTWISESDAKEIVDRSPETVTLFNEQVYQLYYTHGVPVINRFNLKDVDALTDNLRLADGREIYINYRIGKDTKHHTASEIKEYAAHLG